jgi:hypothetical protein
MARTVVGLFDNQSLANQVAGELKETGVPSCEIRVLVNPLDLAVNNQMSTPHTDFIAALSRDLREIGATDEEANVYVNGVENGGALVLATGTAEQVDAVASVMNKHHAAEVEKLAGLEPALPATHLGSGAVRQESTLTGRIRQSGGGARIFVW